MVLPVVAAEAMGRKSWGKSGVHSSSRVDPLNKRLAAKRYRLRSESNARPMEAATTSLPILPIPSLSTLRDRQGGSGSASHPAMHTSPLAPVECGSCRQRCLLPDPHSNQERLGGEDMQHAAEDPLHTSPPGIGPVVLIHILRKEGRHKRLPDLATSMGGSAVS